uniref:Uncharacterized protein n=1 Tax=viral metagenome TaxID=1070528 RepID=A0A6M3J018_9ZZZZ
MASENFLARDDYGVTQGVKNLTTASGVVTYTAKTGRDSDGFVIDRIIRVTTTSGNNMAITLPDGVYYGQTILVIFEVEANAETLDVTASTGDSATQMTAAGGFHYAIWSGPTIGWTKIAGDAGE